MSSATSPKTLQPSGNSHIASNGQPSPTHTIIKLWKVVLVEGQSVPTGPLEDKIFHVREQSPSIHIYQFQKSDTRSQNFVLEGERNGLIEIQSGDGLLHTTGQLYWSMKHEYRLQVKTVDYRGAVIEGPRSVIIIVDDINDNIPLFNRSEYRAQVREQTKAGIPFVTVYATDEDDPSTPNGQFVYKITKQIPNPDNVMLFQINNITGEISTTEDGQDILKAERQTEYELVLTVSDLAEHPFSSNTKVFITVIENFWKPPKPVILEENSTLPHPHKITQVRWNEEGVIYELHQREKLPRFPFIIDQNGDINVTEPLDREERQLYVFYALVKNHKGMTVARPVKIEVTVTDINDNPPMCPAAETIFEVQENEVVGSIIDVLSATDKDQEDSKNSNLEYKILEQLPQIPMPDMFLINQYGGSIQLKRGGLNIQDNEQYRLKVEVNDEGEPRLSTICWVVINVIDINDNIPIFETSDYGSITLSEDTPFNTTVKEIQAWDADQPQTGSSAISYQIIEGDPAQMFIIVTDSKTQRGYIKVNKPLDYESFKAHVLVIQATNLEPLVTGIAYNESSITRLRINITDVDEKPAFSDSVYQVHVKENVAIGTKLIHINASDPEGDSLVFSLNENTRNWLRIDEYTGEVFVRREMDRELQSPYLVEVVASERKNPKMRSSVFLHVFLDDVNDNPPRLAKDYYGDFSYCYPLTKPESFEFQGTDDDYSPSGISLKFEIRDTNFTNDWSVLYVNRTTARLTMKHTQFPMGTIRVPVVIWDNGWPRLEATVKVPVVICTCTSKNVCETEPVGDLGRPSVGMALGILFGVLGVIGIILAAVFISMHHKNKKNKGQNGSPAERERMADSST
ncbi:cadherin-17 [Gastrophryne carolinensis]